MICIICDDQQQDLEAIEKIVSKYANEHPDILMDIRCFSNAFEMMEFIEKNGIPEIAILDIYMPGTLGTDIAKQIRSIGQEKQISYFSLPVLILLLRLFQYMPVTTSQNPIQRKE